MSIVHHDVWLRGSHFCSGLLVKNIDYHVFGGKQTTFGGVKSNANMASWFGGGRSWPH